MFKEIKEVKLQNSLMLSSVHSMAQVLITENIFSVGNIKKSSSKVETKAYSYQLPCGFSKKQILSNDNEACNIMKVETCLKTFQFYH